MKQSISEDGDCLARPRKKGLDYFPFDVDFFSDKKIKRLRARYGNDGILVYIYLLCEIYRSGYYIDYDEDLILDVSDELNISENETKQIMNYLLSRSLFDDTLAKSVKVLTAASVQRRYQEAKKYGKTDIEVEAKFWVLKKEDTLNFIKVRPTDGFSDNNTSFSKNNSDKSRINDTKESKVKKSKVNESNMCSEDKPQKAPLKKYGAYQHILLSDDQYKKLTAEYGEPLISEYIRKMDEWIQMKGKSPYKDYSIAIKNWIKKDGSDNDSSEHSYSLNDYKSLVNNFGGMK